MENNPVLLKSSVFGGFKKKDVLSYIFELNETTQEEKQKLAEQLEELVQSRDNLAASAAEMEQRLAALQASLDDAQARLDEETAANARSIELIEMLRAEADRYENTVLQQNAEIARQAEINAHATAKNRAYEEKRHQVELAASQIAELLAQAKEDAAKTVERAQEDAAKTMERAKQESAAILEQAKRDAENTVETAKASLGAHVERANASVDGAYQKFGVFKAGLENLHRAILDTTNAINEEMRTFKDSIGDIEALVPQQLTVEDVPVAQSQPQQSEIAPEVLQALDALDALDAPEASEPDDSPVQAEESPVMAAAAPAAETEAENMTQNLLRSYGVRKDDSGFFRLAAD